MMRVVKKTEGRGGAETEVLEDGIAVEQILSGEACLGKRQPKPPQALLNTLAPRIRSLDVFGPAGIREKILQNVSESVVKGGVRQSVVEGLPLAWLNGRPRLIKSGRQLLLGLEHLQYEPIEQMQAAIAAKKGPDRPTIAYFSKGAPQQSGRKRLGPDWEAFETELTTLTNEIDGLLWDGATQGRILCVEEAPGGASLVHPKLATERLTKPNSRYYCMSRDLPKGWFTSDEPKHSARYEAAHWMKKCFLQFESQDRRVSSQQLQAIAMKKFGITENGAAEAWKTARVDLDIKSGRIPRKECVNDNEINDIN